MKVVNIFDFEGNDFLNMKLSIITVTFNNAKNLKDIYDSLLINMQCLIEFEWLIMDDGSTDNTKDIIEKFNEENKVCIDYHYQEHQGKTIAINNIIKYTTGDLILECNPDEYLANNAFEVIKEKSEIFKQNNDIYAILFLKCDIYGEVSGKEFPRDNYKTKIFDLYFKDDIKGQKILVFNANIRKQYKHELENMESFVIPNRMYYKMEYKNSVICFNIPIMIGDIQKEDKDEEIKKIIENPIRI